ncbi:MAG: hypothetical protein RBR38_08835 [Desulfomicrobium apsheronum]|nr:hypothetical protein [Desulfomicrobium apsheronum]
MTPCFRPKALLFPLMACAAVPDETMSGIDAAMEAPTDQDALPAQGSAAS